MEVLIFLGLLALGIGNEDREWGDGPNLAKEMEGQAGNLRETATADPES